MLPKRRSFEDGPPGWVFISGARNFVEFQEFLDTDLRPQIGSKDAKNTEIRH